MESRAEKRDRVASILGSDEFSVLGSPTKKALRYKYLQPIMGYPDVSVAMAFKSKSSPKRNCVTQLHDYLNKYVTYDSDVCSYELISLSSSIPVKEFSISLLAAEI